MITHIITIAIAAHWSIVSYTPQSGKHIVYPKDHQELAGSLVQRHILKLIRALLQVGIEQLQEAVSTTPELAPELSSKALTGFITAPFRRMLPALHVASRWLRMHVDLFVKGDVREEDVEGLGKVVDEFWPVFADFSTRVSRIFPIDRLPKDDVTLEEDIELRGFLPFEKDQAERPQASRSPSKRDLSEVHPNDEHLMRIRDLQLDALYLVEIEVSVLYRTLRPQPPGLMIPSLQGTPLRFVDGKYIVQRSIRIGGRKYVAPSTDEFEDDARTVSTEDPVGLAMAATPPLDEDDEEEQILYPQIPSLNSRYLDSTS